MPLRTKIRAKYSDSSGGGSTPTFGNVAWGPDFGEGAGSDNNTFTVGANLDLDSVDLVGNLTTGVQVTMPQLELGYTGPSVGVNLSQDAGFEYSSGTVNSVVTMPSLRLQNDKTVGAQVTMPELALLNEAQTVGCHLSGSALGAPFWQSAASNSGSATITGTLNITKPAGTVEGDLMVAFITVSGAGSSVTSVPSGWSTQTSSTTAQPFVYCYTKVAGASEGGSYDWGVAATAAVNYAGGIHRINGFDTTTPVNASGANNGNAADPIANGVTTTSINCLVLAGVAQNSATTAVTFTPPTNWTERWDVAGGTVQPVSQTSATRVFAATGATGNQTYNSSALVASNYSCVTIAIAPGSLVIAT